MGSGATGPNGIEANHGFHCFFACNKLTCEVHNDDVRSPKALGHRPVGFDGAVYLVLWQCDQQTVACK